MEWMLRRSTQLMEGLPWLRWSSFNLFLHSAVQMYAINIFIHSYIIYTFTLIYSYLRSSWVKKFKPNWLDFTSLRSSSPIPASKATSKRTSERQSYVSFRVRFSRDFSWRPHTLCYSSLATRKRTSERWSCVSFRVRFSRDFSWLPHTLIYSSLPPEASKGSPKYIKQLTFNLAELPNSVAKLWLTDDNINKGSDWLWLHNLTVLSHDDVRSQLLSWLKFTLVTEPSWPTTG